MLTIEDIRRRNARELAEKAGSQARLALRLGMSRQQMSAITGRKKHGETSEKNIGSELARKIEDDLGLERGRMDHLHNEMLSRRQDEVSIDIPSIYGEDAAESTRIEALRLARVSKTWLRMQIAPTALENLALMSHAGDGMAPTIEDGAVLLVDTGVRRVKTDSVYVLGRGDDVVVKRVQLNFPKGVTISGDNSKVAPQTFDSIEAAGVTVRGRVLLAWNARKF